MAYTPIGWVDGSTPSLNAANLNHMDQGIQAAVRADTVTTKGDLIVATGNAAVARLAAGTDGQELVPASGQALGVQWRDRPYIDIRDYGFSASNSRAANTTAFQNALNAAIANTWGATIVIPAGIFYLNTVVIPNSRGITIKGAGQMATWLAFSGTNGFDTPSDGTASGSYLAFEDFYIYNASQGNDGIHIRGYNNVTIRNLRVTVWSNAIVAEANGSNGCLWWRLDNNIITNNGIGIQTINGSGGLNQWTVTAGYIASNTTGINLVVYASEWSILGTDFSSNTTALQIASRGTLVASARFEANTTDVYFDTTSEYNRIWSDTIATSKVTDASSNNSNFVDAPIPPIGNGTAISKEALHTINPLLITTNVSVNNVNDAIFMRFTPTRMTIAQNVVILPGVAGGNVSIAIFEDYPTATLIAATATTALQTPNYSTQTIPLTSSGILFPGHTYRIGIAIDSTSAAVAGIQQGGAASYTFDAAAGTNQYAMVKGSRASLALTTADLSGQSPINKGPWIAIT